MDGLSAFLAEFTYAAILGALIAAGVGVPIPEDVTLITSGWLLHRGVVSLVPLVLVILAGILIGDTALFVLGWRLGKAAERSTRAARILSPERRDKVDGWFKRFGLLTVFFARFVPGLRAPVFLVAGSTSTRWSAFALVDGLAACLSIPIWLGLSWLFADRIEWLLDTAAKTRTTLLIVIGSALVVGVLVWLVRHRFRRHQGPTAPASDGDAP